MKDDHFKGFMENDSLVNPSLVKLANDNNCRITVVIEPQPKPAEPQQRKPAEKAQSQRPVNSIFHTALTDNEEVFAKFCELLRAESLRTNLNKGPYATRQKWWHVIKALHRLGLVTRVDYTAFGREVSPLVSRTADSITKTAREAPSLEKYMTDTDKEIIHNIMDRFQTVQDALSGE